MSQRRSVRPLGSGKLSGFAVIPDHLGCALPPDQSGQLLLARATDVGNGPIMAQQLVDRARTERRDALQLAANKGQRAFFAVKRDAETVRLVADVHQHFERLAVAVDVVGQRVVREIDLLDALGQTDDRYFVFQSEPLQRLVGESELSLAAVDDDEVRQFFFGQFFWWNNS